MRATRAHPHMHMHMYRADHWLQFAVSTTPRRARAAEKWPISQIFRFFPHLPSEYKGHNSKFLSGTTMLKASRVTLRVSARALLVSASSYGIGFVTKWPIS